MSACSVTQLCLTLCNPICCSPPGSSVHGIFQARKLEWIAISFPGDLPDPGMRPASPVSPALQVDSLLLSHREAIHLTSFDEKCKVQNNMNDKPDTNSTYKYDICTKCPKQGNFCRQEADWWLPGSGDAEGSRDAEGSGEQPLKRRGFLLG